jgi:hypothetical protein
MVWDWEMRVFAVKSEAEVREKISSACESDMSVTVCVNVAAPLAVTGEPYVVWNDVCN